jgi:uncharacterized protein (TIGR02270 family)
MAAGDLPHEYSVSASFVVMTPTQAKTTPPLIVAPVLRQHVDDATILHATRSALTRAPHVKLHHLHRFDERLAAHLDGLDIAGDSCKPMCEAALDLPGPSPMFVATTRALTSRDTAWMQRLIALAEAVPETRGGLISAFGWAERAQLQGVVADYLRSTNAAERAIGVTACAIHRLDPGLGAARLLEDSDPRIRARAYRAAGELGKREFVSRLGDAIGDEDPACAFWAAWSAVLLGDRMGALERLATLTRQSSLFQSRAFQLTLLALPDAGARELLSSLAADPAHLRWAVMGAGLAGDPAFVPWLIGHMSNDALSRLAGQAFSTITGADLASLDLERKPPENFESGPNDDPDDPNVDMDQDDDLPWPDVERTERWWSQHSSRFVPGQRYFVGAPITREQCIEVLKTGYQRQRILAAHHLCLLEPGSVLFEWRAPAWRQAQALTALV